MALWRSAKKKSWFSRTSCYCSRTPAIAQGHHAQMTAKRLEVEAEVGKRLCHLQLYIDDLKHNAAF